MSHPVPGQDYPCEVCKQHPDDCTCTRPKTKKCQIKGCKRRVKQQEWKTEHELNHCMTDVGFTRFLRHVAFAAQPMLKRNIKITWEYETDSAE